MHVPLAVVWAVLVFWHLQVTMSILERALFQAHDPNKNPFSNLETLAPFAAWYFLANVANDAGLTTLHVGGGVALPKPN